MAIDTPARQIGAVVQAPRRHSITRLTRECFIETLKATGNVSEACWRSNISRDYAYDMKKRDAVFAAAWEEAEQDAIDALELKARHRAMVGMTRPVISMGKPVRGNDGKSSWFRNPAIT